MGSEEDVVGNSPSVVVGAVLAVVASASIAVGLNLQRVSHLKLRNGAKYTTSPLWWIGTVLMGLGEAFNFAAYGVAPASIVGPLGACTVLFSSLIATFVLKEPFRRRDGVGMLLVTLGSGLIVTVTADATSKDLTAKEVLSLGGRLSFIIFIGFWIALTAFCVWRERKQAKVMASLEAESAAKVEGGSVEGKVASQKKVSTALLWSQLAVCSCLGGVAVMFTKCLSAFLVVTLYGQNQFANVLPYIFVIGTIGVTVIQMQYLNKAMALFGASEVVPVYYVMFSLATIICGGMLFEEFSGRSLYYLLTFTFAVMLNFLGVGLVTSKRKRHVDDSECDATPLLEGPEEALLLDQGRQRAPSVSVGESGSLRERQLRGSVADPIGFGTERPTEILGTAALSSFADMLVGDESGAPRQLHPDEARLLAPGSFIDTVIDAVVRAIPHSGTTTGTHTRSHSPTEECVLSSPLSPSF